MPRHFKVTVNGREYEVSVLELGTGQTQSVAAAAPVAGTLATAANTTTTSVFYQTFSTTSSNTITSSKTNTNCNFLSSSCLLQEVILLRALRASCRIPQLDLYPFFLNLRRRSLCSLRVLGN